MTNEKLVKHWKISLGEVKRISDFINKRYELDVIPVTDGSLKLWQGVMYAYDPKNKYILMESQDKFASRDQAILHWMKQVKNTKLSPGQAKLMGVPEDAFQVIKPIEGYERVLEQATTPIVLGKSFPKRQHD